MNTNDTTTTNLLEELYRIDPTLRQFEADLPNLITHLTHNRPSVVINETFVHNLRASLLNQAATVPIQSTAAHTIPSVFIWWVARLSPLGIAVIMLITLIPTITIAPHPTPKVTEPDPITEEITTQSDEMMVTTPPDDASASMMTTAPEMVAKKAAQNSFEVTPPLSGTTVTITQIALPEPGWAVITRDDGGVPGEELAQIYLEAGVQQDIIVPLSKTLQYPGIITVTVYTGNNPRTFVAMDEQIQNDPTTGIPLTVTVPVISELEIEVQQ
jgi:hypothetical protein